MGKDMSILGLSRPSRITSLTLLQLLRQPALIQIWWTSVAGEANKEAQQTLANIQPHLPHLYTTRYSTRNGRNAVVSESLLQQWVSAG